MNRSDARVVELDVRPHLRSKLEPFRLIMDTVKTLGSDDIFVLHATFKPTPLLGVMKMKGFAGKAEHVGEEHWKVTFVRKKNRHWLDEPGTSADAAEDATDRSPAAAKNAVDRSSAGTPQREREDEGESEPRTIRLDNRGLEPPQPMMRTLAAQDRCKPGDEVVIHNDRVPVFLLEELNGLGFPYSVEEQPDGSAIVKIRKV